MSRIGKQPVKLPPSVSVNFETVAPERIPPFKAFSATRMKHAKKNRPSYDSFAAFGEPQRVVVKGPLGELQFPVHSYVRVEQEENVLLVHPQCDGMTKLGRTLWGTTRSYLQSAVRGVSLGFRKELELHGVGFKARVEPTATAKAPAGEQPAVIKPLGLAKYGESLYHKGPGPLALPDPMRGGALAAGAGGGFRRRQPALRPLAGHEGESAEGGMSLMLRIGFCHEVRVDFPPHLTVTTPTPTTIVISGIDAQQVGMAAARVRLLRKPDAYKGKGIRYKDEVVRVKPGKRK